MKKNRLAAGALTLAVSMMACGCSQMYELTDSEEAAVVNYAARAVTKFNLKQTEGISNVAVLEKRMEDEKLEAQEKEKEKQREQSQTEGTKPGATAPSGSTDVAQQEQPSYVSLNQALKLGGIDAVYRSYETAATYEQSESFMVTANDGNELLILHIDLKNNSNKKANCDIFSKTPTFRLTVNKKESVPADTTLLLNDLSTYQGEIQPGNKQGTVLVFQVKKGTVKKIKEIELEVAVNGASSVVKVL